jgi:hypothetical protein
MGAPFSAALGILTTMRVVRGATGARPGPGEIERKGFACPKGIRSRRESLAYLLA